MKVIHRIIIAAALGSLAAGAPAAGVKQKPKPEARTTRQVLAAMERSSTWGHPDLYGEFTGMQRYAAGNYKAAMKYFLIGARFADKLSQLSIGLMYLNGQGVQKDPVSAFAWIAIAAERKYPQFLATRDAVWAQLDGPQREQARALLEKLYPEYGDPAAKRRMTMRLRWNRTEQTGSMLGFGGSSVTSLTPEQFNGTGPMPACGADTIGGAAITGCGNLYASWRWNPKEYFKARDSEWTGTVTVGPLTKADAARVPLKQPDRQKDLQ